MRKTLSHRIIESRGNLKIVGLKERREREKQARRESILVAARELLHQKGMNGASMNQIAKKSELGVATLYSYFKNKDDLFATLQQEAFDLLKEMVAKILENEENPRNQLRKIASSFLDFSQARKNYYYIINYFISTSEIIFEPKLKKRIDQQGEQVLLLSGNIIQEGINKGVFKATDVKRSSIMFWILIHGLTNYRKFETTVLNADNYLEFFKSSVDQFIDSLC